jgi:hypothetical protein
LKSGAGWINLKYAEKYKKASKEYEKYKSKIKNGNAEQIDFIKLKKAEKDKKIAENSLYNVPKVIKGGNLDKVIAEEEAKNKHKIGFLA